jgi:Spy/CpxP family protein refolding chaperone
LKRVCVLVCVGLTLVLVVHQAWARESPRDVIRAYRIWKLTDLLELSDEQMPVFFSKLQRIEDRDTELREEEREAVRSIADLLERDDAGEGDLREALNRYEEIQRKRMEEMASLRQEAISGLSMKQKCQYVVFDQRFKTELRSMIERVRGMEGRGMWEEGGEMEEGGFGTPEGFGDRQGSGPRSGQHGGGGHGRR